jgi:hypothetical protein
LFGHTNNVQDTGYDKNWLSWGEFPGLGKLVLIREGIGKKVFHKQLTVNILKNGMPFVISIA